jgi:hypothetical protein
LNGRKSSNLKCGHLSLQISLSEQLSASGSYNTNSDRDGAWFEPAEEADRLVAAK